MDIVRAIVRRTVTVMTITNQFDKPNRLTAISSAPSASSVVSFNYGYNLADQRTAVTNADGSYWLWGYDDLGQVISAKKYWPGGTPVLGQQLEYSFDDIGNRKTAVTGGDQWGANKRYQNYSANLLNQYEQRTVPAYLDILGAATNTATVTVNNLLASRQGEYFRVEVPLNNATGAVWLSLTNLATLPQGTNADITATNIGAAFIPKTPEAFRYDSDGNLTNDGRWAYTWDAENRLVRMVSLSTTPTNCWKALRFSYDPQSRRISKVVSNWNGATWTLALSNKFLYDGWNLIAELSGTNNAVIRSYAWGTDLSGTQQGAGGVGGLLLVKDASGGAHFPAFDGNGNAAALVNATTGTISANYEHGPFGEPLRVTGPNARAFPFRFSTKYQDDETDLLYYGYRYHNACSGRWISRDPIGEKGGLNLYGVLQNALLNRQDYLGLIEVTDHGGGELTIEVGPCEVVRVIGHGNPRGWPRFFFPLKKIRQCPAAGGFIGCYAEEINRALAEKGRMIPGSPREDGTGLWSGLVDPYRNTPDWTTAVNNTTAGMKKLATDWVREGKCSVVYVYDVDEKGKPTLQK